jgi:hypothetical protein
MKATKRRILLHVIIDPATKVGLELIGDTYGMKPQVIANRVLGWAMSQDSRIREMILKSDSAESDANLSKLILRRIAQK